MAKFSVGYQLMSGEPDYFSDIVTDYKDYIREVFFAWPGVTSGRDPLPDNEATIEQMSDELSYIKSLGIKLNLLFNASCYGAEGVTEAFSNKVKELVGYLNTSVGIDSITALSPVIAGTVKEAFPHIDIRASVNMKLGTVRAMDYVSDLFDSYYVQREFNRDPERLKELQEWADNKGKKLYMLANSGCMNFCSFQMFHDNTVAHGGEMNNDSGTLKVSTLCRKHYSAEDNRVNFLRGSWIRPEDIEKHQRIFSGGFKLATRMHTNPRMVIDAYARGKFHGNLRPYGTGIRPSVAPPRPQQQSLSRRLVWTDHLLRTEVRIMRILRKCSETDSD